MIGAGEEYENLIGRRLLKIATTKFDEVFDARRLYITADTDYMRKFSLTIFLIPELTDRQISLQRKPACHHREVR
jgi:hypothetical protein